MKIVEKLKDIYLVAETGKVNWTKVGLTAVLPIALAGGLLLAKDRKALSEGEDDDEVIDVDFYEETSEESEGDSE